MWYRCAGLEGDCPCRRVCSSIPQAASAGVQNAHQCSRGARARGSGQGAATEQQCSSEGTARGRPWAGERASQPRSHGATERRGEGGWRKARGATERRSEGGWRKARGRVGEGAIGVLALVLSLAVALGLCFLLRCFTACFSCASCCGVSPHLLFVFTCGRRFRYWLLLIGYGHLARAVSLSTAR